MKKWYPCVIASLAGIVYGLVMLFLSRFLIRNLSGLFCVISTITDIANGAENHIIQILDQLKTAHIVSPWAAALLLCIAAGIVYFFLIRRCNRKFLLSCCIWIPVLLPLTLLVACFTEVNSIRLSGLWTNAPETPAYQTEIYTSDGDSWHFGFGRRQILPDETGTQPLYIAGYNSGVEITGVLDYCEARAVWLDTGKNGILLIGIDCVALDSGTVGEIRENLSDLPNCAAIHVYSTHTHAGIDTLGLWGPVAVNGKNDAYMASLVQAATEAGRDAANNRTAGALYFGQTETRNMFRDSRDPQVFDANLYQLRFSANDGSTGLRMLFYGAHAESLRGNNTLLSRDFPGVLCDDVAAATGDNTLFLPGAIGGLIMTKEFTATSVSAEKNLMITAEKLVSYALSITEETEQAVSPNLTLGSKKFVVPMDNIGFMAFKYLGILNNKPIPADSATGYGVETELSILILDELAIAMIPGEIFPELVYGGNYGDASPENQNPVPLCQIAAQYGLQSLLIVGLSNDEIGYIVPPSDFLLNENMPYLEKTMDYKGENHYEETNSVGPECANRIADTFAAILKEIKLSG